MNPPTEGERVSPRRPPLGWIIAGLLFCLWLFLQMGGWWYTFRVARLERKLQQLRPTLSAIVLSEQLETTRQGCLRAFEEVRQIHVPASAVLELLSWGLPPSVTIEQLELDSVKGLKLRGSLSSGIRDPEAVIALFSEKLKSLGGKIRVKGIIPQPMEPGVWRFELKVEPN